MPKRSAAAFLGLALLCSAGPVLADVPLDLKKVTGPSAWLGTAVMTAWWTADGRHLYWQQMDPAGGGVLTWEMSATDGTSTLLAAPLPPAFDGPATARDPAGGRFVRLGSDGEVWLIDEGQGGHSIDDEVIPFEAALRVVQRLLDLGKENWDFAAYPTGWHCFGQRPDLRPDAYRRTIELFDRILGKP